MRNFRSIMEDANWVCDDALDDHVWVSELSRSKSFGGSRL